MKRIEIEEGVVADPVKTAIYRVVQEAMHNVTRHSCADSTRRVAQGGHDWVELTIEDDGRGFDG